MRASKIAGAAVAAIAAATAPVVPFSSPRLAAATPFDNDGAWSDEHTLGYGVGVTQGDVVGLWQHILISSDTSMPGQYMTEVFGPKTRDYTTWYQATHGITADGVVGPQTWNAARWWVGQPTVPCTTDCDYEFNQSGAPLYLYQNTRSGGTWKWSGICGYTSSGGDLGTDHPGINNAGLGCP